jgi:hypothetical protein
MAVIRHGDAFSIYSHDGIFEIEITERVEQPINFEMTLTAAQDFADLLNAEIARVQFDRGMRSPIND